MPTTNSQQATFGAWLKQRRKELDLTQAELAGQIGCAADTVKKMESGALRPSKQLAELLAVFFGIPTSERAAFVGFARGVAANTNFETVTRAGEAQNTSAQPAGAALFHAPAPVTSLIGRTREVQAAVTLLLQSSTRLLTLYGPPGVGKTRLSQEIAMRLQSEFTHGVCFAYLAPITSADLVLPAIAAALHLKVASNESLLQSVQQFLTDKKLLLVLDNFEQVVDAAPVVHDLLTAAPGVKALISSREVLKLYGEQGFPLPPLEVPDVRSRSIPPLEAIALYPSVELFVQRARAHKPDFVLSRANASNVAQICAWLDGLPLAIEMAAAQVKWMALPRLLSELSNRLTELTGGMRDLSPRQQTLRGAIDWSFQLLNKSDGALFTHLAIFVDGFTVDAAMDVISDWLLTNPGSPLKPLHDGSAFSQVPLQVSHMQYPIASALEQLADKSLLRHETDREGNARFSMFEMIREYALEKMSASADMLEIGRRHAMYFLLLAKQAESEFGTSRDDLWMNRLDADLGNIRAAFDWFTANDPVNGLELAVRAWPFFSTRGYLSEIRARLHQLLSLAGNGAPDLLRAWALRAAAADANHQGDWQQSSQLADQCLEIFRAHEARDGIAAAVHLKGGIAFMRSEYADAAKLFTEALVLYRETGNLQSAATILRNLGLIAKDQGEYARAISLYEESMALHRTLGNNRGAMASMTQVSIAYYWMGDYDRSAEVGEQVLALYRGSENRLDEAYALENLGMVYYKMRDWPRAESMLNESLDMMRDLGNQSGMALLYTDYGQLSYARGERVRAVEMHRQGLHYSVIVDDKRRTAFCLEGLAIALGERQPLMSARLFGAADQLRAVIGSPLPPSEMPDYNAGLLRARTLLGDAVFESAFADGASMPLQDAITLAAA
ncbi:MAG TPA: tetratricopeptide repeat protein [Anaerolineae bacterium]|jgi:predicted ATPase/transcriptional regulator with XRE-family HTH domain